MPERRLIRARWIFPTGALPIADGLLEIEDGIVAGISASGGKGKAGGATSDLGNVAIIPGLVNVHTHLEFSHLPAPIAAGGTFARWIADVIAERAGRPGSVEHSRQMGLIESRSAGIAALGEIATSAWKSSDIPTFGPPIVLFREVLGLGPESVPQRIADLESHLAERSGDPARIRRGLSPHAPYSVHPDLFEGTLSLARRHDTPVAMHLAETAEERQLLWDGTGPLVDLFTRMGIWRPGVLPVRTRPIDYLRRLADLPEALVIHGNDLDDEEVRFIADHPRMAVVYCPQTHRHFRRPRHPLPKLLEAGGRVALGTDSRASSPSLSLWDDVLLVRRAFPEIPPPVVLDLATVRGAEVLGLDGVGRLQPGSPASLTLVSLPDGLAASDPWGALFADGTRSRPFEPDEMCEPWLAGGTNRIDDVGPRATG